MAIFLIPCSYRCDCGHISHLTERVVREMEAASRQRPERMRDSQPDPHSIEFVHGKAVAVICPRLGRCEITGWE
jgi:hypothetical protein